MAVEVAEAAVVGAVGANLAKLGGRGVEAAMVVAAAAAAAVGTAVVALAEGEWARETVVGAGSVGAAEWAACWVGAVAMAASSLRRHHRGLGGC